VFECNDEFPIVRIKPERVVGIRTVREQENPCETRVF
jgi:hypothetical protein